MEYSYGGWAGRLCVVPFEAEERSALLIEREFHGRVYGFMNYVLFIWGIS